MNVPPEIAQPVAADPRLRPLRVDVVVPIVVALAVAFALKLLVVEPPAIGQACDLAPWQGACALRSALVQTFASQQLGWVALVFGVLAVITRARWATTLALVFGSLGLVLYSYDPSAIGLLLGLLAACRRNSRSKP